MSCPTWLLGTELSSSARGIIAFHYLSSPGVSSLCTRFLDLAMKSCLQMKLLPRNFTHLLPFFFWLKTPHFVSEPGFETPLSRFPFPFLCSLVVFPSYETSGQSLRNTRFFFVLSEGPPREPCLVAYHLHFAWICAGLTVTSP